MNETEKLQTVVRNQEKELRKRGKKLRKLTSLISLLEDEINVAIDMLDGNDDESLLSDVQNSELIRKLTEHLEHYHSLLDTKQASNHPKP